MKAKLLAAFAAIAMLVCACSGILGLKADDYASTTPVLCNEYVALCLEAGAPAADGGDAGVATPAFGPTVDSCSQAIANAKGVSVSGTENCMNTATASCLAFTTCVQAAFPK